MLSINFTLKTYFLNSFSVCRWSCCLCFMGISWMLFVLFQWEVLSTAEDSKFSGGEIVLTGRGCFRWRFHLQTSSSVCKNSLRILSTFQGTVFRWTSWVRLRPLDGTSVWVFWPPAASHSPQCSSSVTSAGWVSSEFRVCRLIRSRIFKFMRQNS